MAKPRRRVTDDPENGRAVLDWLRRNVSLLNTILLAVIALMALWFRAESFKFAKEQLQPLADKLVEEKYERNMAIQRVENSTARLDDSVKELNETIREMRIEMKKIYEEAVPRAR